LKFRFSILLFSIALCAEAQAAPTPENEAIYEHAVRLGKAFQERLDQLILKEQQGEIDKLTMNQSLHEAMKGTEEVEEELRKASAGGHGVATYALANAADGRADALETLQKHGSAETSLGDYRIKRAEACALYQLAWDQGLIAGAVTALHSCDEAFIVYKLANPESLRKQSQLVSALNKPDLYSDYYPLPARGSYCFKDLRIPEGNPAKPLSAMRDAMEPVSLSQEQFRADGYYLLALKGDIAGPKVRDYFKHVQALAPDCLDPAHLQALFKNMERNKP
jgi:hypothetical protein